MHVRMNFNALMHVCMHAYTYVNTWLDAGHEFPLRYYCPRQFQYVEAFLCLFLCATSSIQNDYWLEIHDRAYIQAYTHVINISYNIILQTTKPLCLGLCVHHIVVCDMRSQDYQLEKRYCVFLRRSCASCWCLCLSTRCSEWISTKWSEPKETTAICPRMPAKWKIWHNRCVSHVCMPWYRPMVFC